MTALLLLYPLSDLAAVVLMTALLPPLSDLAAVVLMTALLPPLVI